MTAYAMIELESWIIYQCVLNECGGNSMSDHQSSGNNGGSTTSWCAREISLRAQKKLLSRVGGAAGARALVLDEQTARALEQLTRVLRVRTDKKEAEKLVKHVIKVAVKLVVLRRHGELTAPDLRALDTFRSKFHNVLMAVISFCEVEFSYDRVFLQSALHDSHQALKSVVERHLTEKSVSRLAGVFAVLTREDVLDGMFSRRPPDPEVTQLARLLRRALDAGTI